MNKIKILDLPKASKILITGHVNPDGDALGSGLALKIVLDNLKYDSVISYDFSIIIFNQIWAKCIIIPVIGPTVSN